MTRDELNAFCRGLTATSYVMQWGGSDVWKVGGKVFAMWSGSSNGITFKVEKNDYEVLREMPGLRPAPYLASRGMTWIQQYESPGLEDELLQQALLDSHRIVAAGLSRKKQRELGLLVD